ncbi:MAG: alpha/beta hydrolase [Oscillospiraceae bacterium]|nr:alpha/beta hydrolase [Oscillospiraceae bacterium]
MNDYLRESLSYFGLYRKMLQVKKKHKPVSVSYGKHKDQYFLYYEPNSVISNKIIVWVHGGGWNAGNPRLFDFVGQCVCNQGYRFVSLGYRLSPKYKYPCQIQDVCEAFHSAVGYMADNGIDGSEIIAAGPSAGAHLTSILCYSRKVQEKYGVDVSNIKGFIGSGGPYSFREDQGLTIRLLLGQLFRKGYNRKNGEPLALMDKSNIPMLLIQSKHDGLVEYACAEDFAEKARKLGIPCELYSVTDKKNTHSWYTAGMFLESREENQGLDKFFSWIEEKKDETSIT